MSEINYKDAESIKAGVRDILWLEDSVQARFDKIIEAIKKAPIEPDIFDSFLHSFKDVMDNYPDRNVLPSEYKKEVYKYLLSFIIGVNNKNLYIGDLLNHYQNNAKKFGLTDKDFDEVLGRANGGIGAYIAGRKGLQFNPKPLIEQRETSIRLVDAGQSLSTSPRESNCDLLARLQSLRDFFSFNNALADVDNRVDNLELRIEKIEKYLNRVNDTNFWWNLLLNVALPGFLGGVLGAIGEQSLRSLSIIKKMNEIHQKMLLDGIKDANKSVFKINFDKFSKDIKGESITFENQQVKKFSEQLEIYITKPIDFYIHNITYFKDDRKLNLCNIIGAYHHELSKKRHLFIRSLKDELNKMYLNYLVLKKSIICIIDFSFTEEYESSIEVHEYYDPSEISYLSNFNPLITDLHESISLLDNKKNSISQKSRLETLQAINFEAVTRNSMERSFFLSNINSLSGMSGTATLQLRVCNLIDKDISDFIALNWNMTIRDSGNRFDRKVIPRPIQKINHFFFLTPCSFYGGSYLLDEMDRLAPNRIAKLESKNIFPLGWEFSFKKENEENKTQKTFLLQLLDPNGLLKTV